MSRVRNPNTVEGVIHQAFHLLAKKHGIDVDKISEIISDYLEWVRKNLRKRYVWKVRSKTGNYSKIIEVDAPVRFFWLPDGTYDGFEFGEFKDGLTRHQGRLLDEVFDVMETGMPEGKTKDGGVPEAIEREFGDNL